MQSIVVMVKEDATEDTEVQDELSDLKMNQSLSIPIT